MRLKLLTILMLCSFMAAKAQISITKDDLPKVWQTYSITYVDTNLNFDLSTNGTNGSWDVSGIDLSVSDKSSSQFLKASETPHTESFPEADLSLYIEDEESYLYLQNSNNGIDVLGYVYTDEDMQGNDSIVIMELNEPFTQMFAPLSLNDEKTTQGVFENTIDIGIAKIEMKSYINRKITVDGYGTLKMTDNKTYDVLRLRIYQKDSTISEINSPFGNQTSTDVSHDYSYQFISKDFGYPLLTAFVDSADNSKTLDIEMVDIENTNTSLATVANKELHIYPNPTTGLINLDYSISNATAVLYNSKGQIEKTKLVNSKTIDFSDVKTGIYLLNIHNQKGSILYSKKIIIN